MNKGFGNNFYKKNNENFLVKDIELSSQTKKAIILAREGKFLESAKIYNDLIYKGNFNHLTFHRLAGIYERLGKRKEAFECLQKAINVKKNYAEAYCDIGRYLIDSRDIKSALNYFAKALEYNPKLLGAYINIGTIYQKLGDLVEAMKYFKKSLEIDNNIPMTFYNIGTIYALEKNFIDAEKNYKSALECNKNFNLAKIGLLETYLNTFNIKSIKKLKNYIDNAGLNEEDEISNLLTFFYLDCSPNKQYKRALNLSKRLGGMFKNNLRLKKNKKIKIGYISANFNDHPVSKIMETIFMYHDKKKFEIHAYSLNNVEDNITKNLKINFNSFSCISSLSVKEAVIKIRSENLDIAVDLMGYTSKNMINIFNQRIAPIQINYLGFPGTTGISNIDFLLGDEFVIPKKFHKYYSEKIIQMPNSFINSIKYDYHATKKVAQINSLPNESIVLAAFHKTSKLSEEVVDAWANILIKSENTYLWLKKPLDIARENILSFFATRKIDKERILFAENVSSYEEHVSRYNSADIFLDTFNYNGHSTLVECIWSELPFVTLVGKSFSSRVGGSILHSLDLDELICKSIEEYIEKVVFYSSNKRKLEVLKNKINSQKKSGVFFNQKVFTKNLEEVYENILRMYK
ncbi:tetratricopeptide repeat protein [Prochlorococcus marinus]|uniref:protein O-GlcNAc transferase n=1 Tax=Prochlorococcus marinus str. GP2 TaxID=59925 RepID=A0A0A1ZEC9_PROMR|nr:glycosyltransferase family 41 protein [Prochlorococcus marinus]KGF86628.1 TPR repeat [Prochlorococcus marinus str. GP2]